MSEQMLHAKGTTFTPCGISKNELLKVTTDANHLTSNGESDVSFGKIYFDSGVEITGYQYAEYSLEAMYPGLEREALLLRNFFNPGMVLDVGCAKGFLVLAFRRMSIKAWGVDISDYALSEAPIDVRAYLGKVDVSRDTLPFHDAEFDLVTALGVLDYAWNRRHALDEFRRVLRPQGVLYASVGYVHYGKPSVPIPQNVNSWIREVEQHHFRYLERLSKQFCRDRLKESVRSSRSIQAKVATRLLVHPFLWSMLTLLLNQRSRARLFFRAE